MVEFNSRSDGLKCVEGYFEHFLHGPPYLRALRPQQTHAVVAQFDSTVESKV